MKNLLTSIAALSLLATPAVASDQSQDRTKRIEQVDRQDLRDRIKTITRSEKRYNNQDRRERKRVDIYIDRRDYRYNSRLCRFGSKYLTVRGLVSRSAPLIVRNRAYRPRHAQCVSRVFVGDIVFQDLNRNGRIDRYEPRGWVERDFYTRRAGYRGGAYTVDLW